MGVSTGSLGAATGGWIAGTVLASSDFKSDKLVIKGEHARVKMTERNPTFRFVLPTEDDYTANAAHLWYYTWMSGIQTPAEFQLIKLKSKGKDKKARRVFPSGLSWSAAGFSTTKDADIASLVEFDIKQINDNTYDITIPDGLEPGEYVFFYRNALAERLKEHLSAFDFSILE